ncbi:MAG: hypothetical protein HFJ48_02865 [Clostridia bacterium]|nr:hypothetical protein [Clostridia bacterium]
MANETALDAKNILHNEEALLLLAEEAKQQGYREGYIECAHKHHIHICVSEAEYNTYVKAKLQYSDKPSIEALNNLVSVTKEIIQ